MDKDIKKILLEILLILALVVSLMTVLTLPGKATAPISAPPTVTTSGGPTTYIENASSTVIESGILIFDSDEDSNWYGGKLSVQVTTNSIPSDTPVNNAPSFTKGSDITVLEDGSAQTIAGWATSLSPGPYDEFGQTLYFTVFNDNNELFSVQPAVASNGTLTFTPKANANGTATVTVSVHDDGGTENGGVDSSAPQTFKITIKPVNNAPSFTKGSDIAVLEDGSAQTIAGWATSLSPGPYDESGQTLYFTVFNDNNELFSVQPAVASNGTLTFTPKANANGTATVTVSVHDDGGTENGGVDSSAPQTFKITIKPVNDAPSFTTGSDITVPEDSEEQTISGWATALSPGPSDESGQTLNITTSNNNNALFSVQPAVASNGTLTFTPKANANGTATVTVSVNDDGGTENGGVDSLAPQTFKITITPVNNAPSFTKGSDITVLEDGSAQTIAGWATSLSPGPYDEFGQTLYFTVFNDNNELFSVQPAVANNGTLTFTPKANANGTATVTVSVHDDGGTENGGVDASSSQVFSITITSVNDAPKITTPASITSSLTGISFADVDAGNANVLVTLSEPSGKLDATSGDGVSVGGSPSELKLTGPISNINSFISKNGVTITNSTDVTLTISINDNGNSGIGGPQTASTDMLIVAPRVTSVSSSTANGSYKAGDVISIQVTFSTAVTVTGTPQLLLETGTDDRAISYVSGSGTNKLTFIYTVQAGDNSSDLNYVDTNSLNGGSITVTVGSTSVSLTLPPLSSAYSLAENKALVVDTTAPNAPTVTTSTQTVNADNIVIGGTAEAGATITITGGSATATGVADGNSNYSISVNLTQNAVNTLVITVTDAAGNNSPTAGVSITEDSMVPTIPSPTIGVSELTYNSAKLTWTAASDTVTTANLQYKVVYSTSNITNVNDANSLSTTWTPNMTTATVTRLTASTDYYFNVLVKDEAGNIALYNSATGKTTAVPVDYTPSTSTNNNAVVEVKEKHNVWQTNTMTIDGTTTITITVDDVELNNFLEQNGKNATVTLKADGTPHLVVCELTGQTIKNMESKGAVFEIKTETVTYTLPASQINIDAILSQLGTHVDLKDIKVTIKIAQPSADTVKVIEDTANRGKYQIVVQPVQFEIMCTSGDRSVEVSHFNGYVERTIAIPDGVDPMKITTGIIVNADGTFSHVPTSIVLINGKYFAKISSLTNSVYTVIYNPVTFTDVSSHWAKDAVNDMGSRMVVMGVGGGIYEPDRSVTRAEFAAIVVRAMGLKKGTIESAFADVTLTDWFNGYVYTATSYSLITGYNSESFAPNDTITREQAMTILARAMKLTGLSVTLTDIEASELLAKYTDAGLVSDYAKAAAAACIKAGVVSGTTASTLSPMDCVTRAEVAAMVQRLLKKSGLI